MDDVPQRLLELPTFLTTQVANEAHRLASQAFQSAGARGYHFRVLAALDELGAMSQADLGRSVGVDRSDVVAVVDDLATAGQVRRERDPVDRRRNVVTITPAGRRQLDRLGRALAAAQDEFLAPLGERERATYRRLLTRLLAHHRAR